MPDRRSVDELTVEELERILVVKRRDLRRSRLHRLTQMGRVANDLPLPEDKLNQNSPTQSNWLSQTIRGEKNSKFLSIEYDAPSDQHEDVTGRKAGASSQAVRTRDRALFALEVLALLGLIAILIGSFVNLRALNEEVAQAREILDPTPTPLIQVSVLPGGSSPPPEINDIPLAYRNLVKPMPPMQIPTPAPQRPTRIVIPAIKVDAPVVHGDSWEELKKGAGHHIGSANPGERGNMIISAHNDVFGEIFRYLEQLELEDRVIVYSGSQSFDYIVKAKRVVEPNDISVMAPTSQPVLTLITCYPYLIDTHRLVVIAQLDR